MNLQLGTIEPHSSSQKSKSEADYDKHVSVSQASSSQFHLNQPPKQEGKDPSHRRVLIQYTVYFASFEGKGVESNP